VPLASFAVSFSPVKGDFTGRDALLRQQAAYRRILARDYSLIAGLPRMTRPVAVTGRGVARAGSPVLKDGRQAGWVTSGTMVPYWKMEGEGIEGRMTGEHDLRSICLALVDSDIVEDDHLAIDIRATRSRRWWCRFTCAEMLPRSPGRSSTRSLRNRPPDTRVTSRCAQASCSAGRSPTTSGASRNAST